MSDPLVVRANDGAAFDDPAAWGFCPWCAFDVAVIAEHNIEHRRTRNGHDDQRCSGSGRETVRPTPVEARPLATASLRKEIDRARRKAYWQRQRFAARATARRKIAEMRLTLNPDSVILHDPATGVDTDITDAIIGPININLIHPDREVGDGDEEERDRS